MNANECLGQPRRLRGGISMCSRRYLTSAILFALCAAGFWGSGQAVFADETLETIIKKVRKHEAHYQNLELLMEEHYDIGDRAPLGDFVIGASPGGGHGETTRKDLTIRQVSQAGKFRVEIKGKYSNRKGDHPSRRTQLFDGKTTRIFQHGVLVRSVAGRFFHRDYTRPHMLLTRHASIPVPFSVYLSGHKAILAHSKGRWNLNLKLQVTYEGEEKYGGRNCHKLSVTTLTKSVNVPSRAEFWLAEDRNYLPIKMTRYPPNVSTDIPICQSTVSDLREIKPGIWFPFDVETTCYNSSKIRLERRQKMQWRRQYTVKKLSLSPKYKAPFFEERQAPAGSRLEDVEKSVKSEKKARTK